MTIQQQVSFLIGQLNDIRDTYISELPIAEIDNYCGCTCVTLQFSNPENNRPILHPGVADRLDAFVKMGFNPIVSACINANGNAVLKVTFYISGTSK